jgi:hypothetical protein
MPGPLARLDDRARLAHKAAVLAILPPLGCHLAAPSLGFDAAAAVAILEVLAAVSLRLAGVPLSAIRPRFPRRAPARMTSAPPAVGAIAS